MAKDFNVFAIVQGGRLQFQALMFVASFVRANPKFKGRLILGEPQPGPRYSYDPRLTNPDVRSVLEILGAEIIPFDVELFGERFPFGNKYEGLKILPKNTPFVAFDTDTIFLDNISNVPFDFKTPAACEESGGLWPVLELYGPGYTEIWTSLYEKFNLDFADSLDLGQPDEFWKKYYYSNASWFAYKNPSAFLKTFVDMAKSLTENPPEALVTQHLEGQLDQILMPLVVTKLGGKRKQMPGGFLDGSVTRNYSNLSMLYARESEETIGILEDIAKINKFKKLFRLDEGFRKMVFQGKGFKARALFDQDNPPHRVQKYKGVMRKKNLWFE